MKNFGLKNGLIALLVLGSVSAHASLKFDDIIEQNIKDQTETYESVRMNFAKQEQIRRDHNANRDVMVVESGGEVISPTHLTDVSKNETARGYSPQKSISVIESEFQDEDRN